MSQKPWVGRRKTIEPDRQAPRYIITEPGVGYFVGLRAPSVANGLTAKSSNCWTGGGTRTTLTFLRKWWIYPLIAVLAMAVVLTVLRQGNAQTTHENLHDFA